MSALTNFPLEGDGIIENLFYYLWCKDELDCGPKINIPDTIIYKYRQPAFWYFTAKDGNIKRKHKGNLVNVRIEEAFTRKSTGSDIIAYYISTAETDDGKPLTTIEYFNKDSFHDFLYNREKVNNGIVQKFIEPKGICNTMIRSIWSPKVCLLERRENNHNLQDRRFGMYERAVTYEGAEFYSSAAPVRGAILPTQVQRLNENIVQHVAEVSFQKYKISRLVSNYKIDSNDKIWLLWNSSLRLEGESFTPKASGELIPKGPLNIDTVVRLPPHVRLGGKHFNPATYLCYGCGKNCPVEQKYTVPYKTVILHFEQLLALLQRELRVKQELTGNTALEIEWPPAPEVIEAWGGGLNVGFPDIAVEDDEDNSGAPSAEEVEIPPVLRCLHPKLKVDDYRRYKNDPLFMYKSVTVCEDCTLVYAEVMSSSSIETLPTAPGIFAGGSVGDRRALRLQQLDPLLGVSHRGNNNSNNTQSKGRLPPSVWDAELKKATMGGGGGGAKSKAKSIQKQQQQQQRRLLGSRSAGGGLSMHTPSFPHRITSQHNAQQLLTGTEGMAGGLSLSASLEEDAMEWKGRAEGVSVGSVASMDSPPILPTAPQPPTLQQREDAFFKELYHNPNLQKGHPLSHMVAAEAKTRAANVVSQKLKKPRAGGSSNSSSSSALGGPMDSLSEPSSSLPPLRKSGKKGGRMQHASSSGPSPYGTQQVLVDGSGRKKRGSKLRGARAGKNKKSASSSSLTSEPSTRSVARERDGKSSNSNALQGGPSESAKLHREFLMATLQDVKEQIGNPPPLMMHEEPSSPSASSLSPTRVEGEMAVAGSQAYALERAPGATVSEESKEEEAANQQEEKVSEEERPHGTHGTQGTQENAGGGGRGVSYEIVGTAEGTGLSDQPFTIALLREPGTDTQAPLLLMAFQRQTGNLWSTRLPAPVPYPKDGYKSVCADVMQQLSLDADGCVCLVNLNGDGDGSRGGQQPSTRLTRVTIQAGTVQRHRIPGKRVGDEYLQATFVGAFSVLFAAVSHVKSGQQSVLVSSIPVSILSDRGLFRGFCTNLLGSCQVHDAPGEGVVISLQRA